MHAKQTGLLALATRVVQACVAGGASGSRTCEPWLSVEELVEGSLYAGEFLPSASSQPKWVTETSGTGSVVPGSIEEIVRPMRHNTLRMRPP